MSLPNRQKGENGHQDRKHFHKLSQCRHVTIVHNPLHYIPAYRHCRCFHIDPSFASFLTLLLFNLHRESSRVLSAFRCLSSMIQKSNQQGSFCIQFPAFHNKFWVLSIWESKKLTHNSCPCGTKAHPNNAAVRTVLDRSLVFGSCIYICVLSWALPMNPFGN